MSIEVSTFSAPQAAEKTDNSKKAKGHEAAPEDGSTFLSLLSSMEPDTGVPPAGLGQALAEEAGNPEAMPPDLLDAGALLAQSAGWSATQPEWLDAATPQSAAGVGLAQSLSLPLPLPLPGAEATGTDAITLPAPRGFGARGADKTTGKLQGATTDMDPQAALTQASATGPGGTTHPGTEAPGARAALQRAGSDRLSQAAASTRNAAVPANEARIAADEARAEWRSSIAAATGATGSSAASGEIGAWARGSGIGTALRNVDRASPRAAPVLAGALPAGSWSQQPALADPSTANATNYTPDLSGGAPEAAVAEKLNYWISRGVQNAELKLDAFGGGSVQVHIAMSGLDAQVEFRSDQPEARRLLTEAMPQLREMLRQEGLSLSGGFVGTSAQSDPGAQERRGQPHGLRMFNAGPEAASMSGSAAVSRTSGRTVDLFV